MTTKTWIIFSVICIALFGGLIYISKKDQVSVDTSKLNENSIIAASAQNGNIADHVNGDSKAKVTVIEYGDFQCPFCGRAYPGLKKTTEDYKDKIAFIFRNFPLTGNHPNALAAATAAEAAGLQGKYWQMHDKLYETQEAWSSLASDQRTDIFVNYAKELGLDGDKFKTAISSENKSISQKISFDQAIGKKIGVNSTPSIYINGKKISDETYSKLVSGDASNLRADIDNALKN